MSGDREVSFVVRVKDAATAALKSIEHGADKVKEKFFSLKDVMGELAGAVAAISLVELVKDMIELGVAADKTFRQIAANLPTFTEGMSALKESIRDIADESGRSVEDMEKAASAIARMGVSSAQELKQQLAAATLLSDATGAGLDESAQLLIQLRREFHLTGDEAEETAAKLASAAKGHVDVVELFSAFQAATPIFQKFNIDVDTATKAIVHLVSEGNGLRQVRGLLNKADADDIEHWASQAHVAADAMEDLNLRAKQVRESVDAANTRLKNDFIESLKELGSVVLPALNGSLKFLAGTLELIEHMNFNNLMALLSGNPVNMGLALLKQKASPGDDSVGHGSSDTIDSGPADAHQTADVRLAAQKQRLLNVELEHAAIAAGAATRATEELARAQGETLKASIEAALGAATGHMAEAAADAINDRIKKLEREVLLNASLDSVTQERLIKELELTRQIELEANRAAPLLASGSLMLSGIGGAGHTPMGDIQALMSQQVALTEEKRKEVALGGDTKLIDQQLIEVEKKRAEILKALGQSQRDMNVDAKAHTATIQQTARVLQQAVDGAIQLGEAFGLVDQKTGNILRSLGQVAAGIGPLVDQLSLLGTATGSMGGVAAAALPVIGGIATLFAGDGGAQAKANAKVMEDNSFALRHLAETLKGIAKPGSSLDAAYGLSAKVKAGQSTVKSSFTPEEWDTLNAAAKELGLTLDGTGQSFVALHKAIELARPGMEANFQLQEKQLREDYQVRQLRAKGSDAEADALARTEAAEREYTKAVADGDDAATLAALASAELAEANKAQADAAREAAEASLAAATKKADEEIQIFGITDPTQQFAKKAQAYKTAGGTLGDLLSQFDLDHLSAEDISRLDDQFKALFKQLEDSPDTVNLAGLSIDDLISALLDLDKSAKSTASGIASAADAMAAAAQKLSLDEQIFGTDPISHAYNNASASGLEMPGFDLSTKAGREGAIKFYQDLYKQHPELGKQIADEIHAIQSIPDNDSGGTTLANSNIPKFGPGPPSAAAQAFQTITTVQGDDLRNILFQSLNVQKEIRDGLFGTFNVGSFKPVSFSGMPGAGASGGPNVGTLNVNVVSLSDDPKAIGAIVGEEVMRVLDVKFGRRILRQKKDRGDIGATPS